MEEKKDSRKLFFLMWEKSTSPPAKMAPLFEMNHSGELNPQIARPKNYIRNNDYNYGCAILSIIWNHVNIKCIKNWCKLW